MVDFGQELVTAVHKAVRWSHGRPTDAEFRAMFMVRRKPLPLGPQPAATRGGTAPEQEACASPPRIATASDHSAP